MVYLALSFYCYSLQTTENRILIWHHLGPAMSPTAIRVHLFKASSLKPVDRMPVYNNLVHDESNKIAHVEGGHLYVDIPTKKTRGIHSFTFPDEMKTISDTAILVSGTDRSIRDPFGSGFPGQSVYILEFAADGIEAVPLDWWNDSEADFGYLWIQRIILDQHTRGLVGDGKGALPFVMYRDQKNDSRWVKHNL